MSLIASLLAHTKVAFGCLFGQFDVNDTVFVEFVCVSLLSIIIQIFHTGCEICVIAKQDVTEVIFAWPLTVEHFP